MSELLPHQPSVENLNKPELKKKLKIKLISLAKELSQRPEGIPFPGINEETLKVLMKSDEDYPGFTTPTKEITSRMKNERVKVVFGEHPDSVNVFVLPFLSDNIEMDSLFPRHLDTTDPNMDPSLLLLILTQKTLFELERRKD